MARIQVKYPHGSKVNVGDIEGKIMAIHIRGRNRAYEFSYISSDGCPTSVTVDEVEISPQSKDRLGFRKG